MSSAKDKRRLLEVLHENHIVLAACRKTGIGKSSYYRWRGRDPKFAAAADTAIQEGVDLVNDAAEGAIVNAIKNQDTGAAKFWLKHRHPAYSTRIQIEPVKGEAELSPEQQALLAKALELADLTAPEDGNNDSHGKGTS